jgi:hypothetical protein
MSIHFAEDVNAPLYRLTDPDAFLTCDNPHCTQPRVTHSGLVVRTIEDNQPSGSRFIDRLLVACSDACLRAAMRAHGRGLQGWSAPMPIADWLDAVCASIELEPTTTPIGEFAGAA